MKINVDINNLKIIDKDQLESGEYNVTDLEFIFSPEYENLQKVAIFGCNLESEDPKYYKVILHDDKCIIPEEVLHKTGQIVIGCYAYEINGEELIKRYSPVPIKIIVEQGSFKDNFENVTPPTPSELEQIQNQINQIEAKIVIINNTLQIYENNFQTINEKIDDIEGDIADTYSKEEIDQKLDDKVDTDVFEESQNAQDEKIALAELILSQWPKVSGEGSNISLSPTLKGKLELEYKGDTKQDTTNGYNLLNVNAETQTINDVVFTIYTDGTIKVNGTATANAFLEIGQVSVTSGESYRLSGCPSGGGSTTYRLYTSNNGSAYDDGSGATLTPSSTGNSRIYIVVYNGTTCNNLIFKPMLEKGTTQHDYEKYTGGIPSPNPNYPQDIQVVTGTQTVTISNADDTESQSYNLHLGDLELAKIGSYQDKIYYNGKWYKEEIIGKKILNGTETGQIDLSASMTNTLRVYYNYNILEPSYYNAMCNRFQVKLVWSTDEEGIYYGGSAYPANTRLNFRINKNRLSELTIDGVNAWLSDNNIIYYYLKRELTITEITDNILLADLNNIKEKAMSYLGTTNISSSGDLPIIISASALKQLS